MSLFFAAGSPTTEMSPTKVRSNLFEALDKLGQRNKVLAVPPDFTRMHSQSGVLTEQVWEYYGDKLTDILPALGTHKPMTDQEIATMYGATPRALFRNHDWRKSNRGRRLDHIWVTQPLVARLRSHQILSDARDYPQGSDHVPVLIDLA